MGAEFSRKQRKWKRHHSMKAHSVQYGVQEMGVRLYSIDVGILTSDLTRVTNVS